MERFFRNFSYNFRLCLEDFAMPFVIHGSALLLGFILNLGFGKQSGMCVFQPPALDLAHGPNLYLPDSALNLCLSALSFTVKVCYSQPRFHCVFSLFSKFLWGQGCVIVTVSTYINSESNYMYLLFKYNHGCVK